MVSMQVTGVSETLRGMRQLVKKDSIKVSDGLKKAAQMVLDKSQKYVPVDTSALKATGRIESNEKAGLAAEATVSYGSELVRYALWVHENTEAAHNPPTCARFLTRAVRELRGSITNMMKRQIEAETVKTIDGKIVT